VAAAAGVPATGVAATLAGVPAAAAAGAASAVAGVAAAVAGVPAGEDAVYRGWMLSSAQYAAFAGALEARGVQLRTSPDEYRTAHELPGWYEGLRTVTPESVWTQGGDLTELLKATRALGGGAGVLRDYVKSMKHYWSEACYLPDLTDEAAVERIGARFLELRDDAFTGGFVVRRFEHFTGSEARTWWVGGRCVLTTPHPDTPDDLPTGLDLIEVEPLVAELALPFVTVDLTRTTTGAWRVVELGDGQVSDWPTTANPAELIAALF
jgi:hypothetical protein